VYSPDTSERKSQVCEPALMLEVDSRSTGERALTAYGDALAQVDRDSEEGLARCVADDA